MITFIIEQKVVQVINDYIKNIKTYLKVHFGVDCQTVIYGPKLTVTPTTSWFNNIVFVQRINRSLYHQLKKLKHTFKIFLLNTEQTTHSKYIQNIVSDINMYNPYVIDYSLENIEQLQRIFGINRVLMHMPYPFTPNINLQTPKAYELVMLANSRDRNNILNKLAKSHKIMNFNNKWANTRDEMIKNSKILVNIHYSLPDYNVFESIRCYGALEQGTLVVSETSINNMVDLLSDYIIFTDRQNIQTTVSTVLQNYDEYYNKIFGQEKIKLLDKKILETFEILIEKFKTLPFNM